MGADHTRLYADELVDPAGTDPETVGFSALTFETFVDALAEVGATTQATYLHRRYLDLTPVLDAVLRNSAAPTDGPDDPPTPPSTVAPAPLLLPPPSPPDVGAAVAVAKPASHPSPVGPGRSGAARPRRRRHVPAPTVSTTPAVSGSVSEPLRKSRPRASIRRSAGA